MSCTLSAISTTGRFTSSSLGGRPPAPSGLTRERMLLVPASCMECVPLLLLSSHRNASHPTSWTARSTHVDFPVSLPPSTQMHDDEPDFSTSHRDLLTRLATSPHRVCISFGPSCLPFFTFTPAYTFVCLSLFLFSIFFFFFFPLPSMLCTSHDPPPGHLCPAVLGV